MEIIIKQILAITKFVALLYDDLQLLKIDMFATGKISFKSNSYKVRINKNNFYQSYLKLCNQDPIILK